MRTRKNIRIIGKVSSHIDPQSSRLHRSQFLRRTARKWLLKDIFTTTYWWVYWSKGGFI